MGKEKTERFYHHYCYLIHDMDNGMKYFGVRSSEKPPAADGRYMGSGSKITEQIKIKGKDKFRKEVLEVFDTRDEAMEYEEWYMTENDCVDSPMFYNLSAKSTGGRFDYHEDLKDGHTSSPQTKNGNQKNAGNTAETAAPKHDDHTLNNDGSPDGRIHHKGQMGGKRPGAGRPKGSKTIFSKKSVEKLQDLGFDPMEELWATYVQVCEDIENTRSISARTALYNTRQKIMTELMKYGYRMVPREDKKEVITEERKPMSIILTDKDEDTTPGDDSAA